MVQYLDSFLFSCLTTMLETLYSPPVSKMRAHTYRSLDLLEVLESVQIDGECACRSTVEVVHGRSVILTWTAETYVCI